MMIRATLILLLTSTPALADDQYPHGPGGAVAGGAAGGFIFGSRGGVPGALAGAGLGAIGGYATYQARRAWDSLWGDDDREEHINDIEQHDYNNDLSNGRMVGVDDGACC